MENKKLNIDIVKENINKLFNGNLSILDNEYKNNKSPLTVRCNLCGYERKVSYNTLSNTKSKCPVCSRKKKKTTEEFKQQIEYMYKNEYSLLDDYVNVSTKILFKHNTCDKLFKMSPSNFLSKHKCPFCSHGSTKYTINEYRNIFKSNDKFIIEDIYCGANNKKCLLKCKKCNNKIERNMYYCSKKPILCPTCESTTSLPVFQIIEYLEENNINYETENIIDELSSYHSYPRFDFKINNDYFIEYDGLQHFKDTIIWSSSAEFIHEKDIKKNNYIKSNNFLLFRIKYNCWRPDLQYKDDLKNIFDLILNSSTTKGIIFISDKKIVSEAEYYQEFQKNDTEM